MPSGYKYSGTVLLAEPRKVEEYRTYLEGRGMDVLVREEGVFAHIYYRRDKMVAINWRWGRNAFLVKYRSGKTRVAEKHEKLPSNAIPKAVADPGKWIEV